MRTELRSSINVTDDFSLVPVSKQMREEHISQMLSVNSLKNMTMEEKKKEANKPIYLVRYE
jgi:hypothetical protein